MVVLARGGLRLLIWPGSARVGRCLGRARGGGPGGEVADELGGEAMLAWVVGYWEGIAGWMV